MKLITLMSVLMNLSIYASDLSETEIIEYIKRESARLDVNPKVAIAIATVESSLRPWVTNWKEKGGSPSRGLFQLLDATAKSVCNFQFPEKSSYMYKLNTKCALKYLQRLLSRYGGDYVKAILAYNAGGYYICHLGHHKKKIPCDLGFPVNIDYLKKVYSHL